MAQPAKSSSASSSAASVSVSRSLVGSSSSRTFAARLQHLCEMHAVALAARELADRLLLVGALEVEGRDVGARIHLAFSERDDLLAAGNLRPDILVAVERAVLVDIAEHGRVADADIAAVRLFLAGQHAGKRRFSGAVRADDRRRCRQAAA